MQNEYADHFLNLKQMIYSPWGYGYSFKGPNDEMSLQLGPIHWLISLLSIGWLIYTHVKNKKINWHWLFYACIFCLSVFAMLPISNFLWKTLPLVRYVQFPWRLLTFATLASAGLSAYLFKRLPKLTIILVVLAIIYSGSISKPGGWFDHDNYFYYEYPFNTSIMSANTPVWFNENKNISLKPGHFFDLKGISQFQEVLWKTQKHVYEINAPQDTEILERTTYFPGWQVTINGQKTNIDFQKEEYPGIITFKVPAGKHLIETKFTENTPARQFGNIVSIIGFATLLIILKTSWSLEKND